MEVKGSVLSHNYFSEIMEGINKLLYIVGEDGSDAVKSDNGDMNFVKDWFLMGNRYTVFIILIPYLLFVLKFGPNYMENRKPYKLTTCLRVYNVLQIIISCFLCYGTVHVVATYGLFPKTCVMETENRRHRIAALMYYYFLAKITELLDTVFFVLRKKEKQLSFLHIYHHCSLMIVVTWTALKYEPTYRLIFLGLVNSFVHVIMYTYYGLASFPSMTKYLWWKKYITSMQLVQFVMVFTHFVAATMVSDCPPSYILASALFFNLFLFSYLFGKFYINTYNKKLKPKATEKVTLEDPKTVLSEMDKKLYQNGKVFIVDANEENYKTASINLNNTYRIKFNLESKKWA